EKSQALDERAERLALAWRGFLQMRAARAGELAARLPHPRQQIGYAKQALQELKARLGSLGPRVTLPARRALADLHAETRLRPCVERQVKRLDEVLESWHARLESLSYENTL